ncbi:MAG: hypothetical protein AAGA46_00555 [Cyanobacteria bacterium P01_F01_bin.13]
MVQTKAPTLSGLDMSTGISLPQMDPESMVTPPEPQFSKQLPEGDLITAESKNRVYVASNLFPHIVLVSGVLLILATLPIQSEEKRGPITRASDVLLGAALMAYKSRTKSNT